MEQLFKEEVKEKKGRQISIFDNDSLTDDKKFVVEWEDLTAEQENENLITNSVFKIFRTFDKDD